MDTWKNLKPKDLFLIPDKYYLETKNLLDLTFLYQPIIGNNSCALYSTLCAYSVIYTNKEISHADILLTQNISLPEFYNARVRLEAIGLLNVFTELNASKTVLYYELKQPMPSKEFFDDDILSSLYLNCVGEEEFIKKSSLLAPAKSKDTIKKKQLTKKFLDVFQFNPKELKEKSDILNQAKSKDIESESPKIDLSNSGFDWELLSQIVNNDLLIQTMDTQTRNTILIYHELYGIDELEIKKFIDLSIDSYSNTIDISFFKKIIKEEFTQKIPIISGDKLVTNDSKMSQISQSSFSKGESSVINSSKNLSPIEFLISIKEQKKGFVTGSEQQIIKKLIEFSTLPKSVLNILIHFVLVVQNNTTLNKNYVETIANDWAQSNVNTPEKAVLKVKEFESLKKKKEKNKKKIVRNESLPEWLTQEKNTSQPLTEERIIYLKEMLNSIEGE